MAITPIDDDHYPNPLVSRPRGVTGLWRVAALAAFFIIAAIGLSALGETVPPDLILVFLGLLAVVGVFCLFAIAAGLFRFSASDDARSLPQGIVDSLPYGALVTDREGRIVYANQQYGQFPGGMADGVPVGVPRLFAGHPEASEAVYRLSRASRDGRPAVEDIRLVGGLGGALGGSSKPFWYRISVGALPQTEGDARPLAIWSVETSRAIGSGRTMRSSSCAGDRLSRSCSGGFFSADAEGRISI